MNNKLAYIANSTYGSRKSYLPVVDCLLHTQYILLRLKETTAIFILEANLFSVWRNDQSRQQSQAKFQGDECL